MESYNKLIKTLSLITAALVGFFAVFIFYIILQKN